jgi:hypothetical protein
MVLDPTLTSAGAVPATWAAAGVTTAGRSVAALPDSAATGNRAPGASSTTAAYRAGSTHITDTANPEDSDPVAVAAVAVAAVAVAATPGNGRDLALQGRGDLVSGRHGDDGVGGYLLPGCGHLGLGHRRGDHVRERHHGQDQHQRERRQDGAGRGTGGPRQADERDHPARPARGSRTLAMPDPALGAGAQLLTWVDEILRSPGPSHLTGLI